MQAHTDVGARCLPCRACIHDGRSGVVAPWPHATKGQQGGAPSISSDSCTEGRPSGSAVLASALWPRPRGAGAPTDAVSPSSTRSSTPASMPASTRFASVGARSTAERQGAMCGLGLVTRAVRSCPAKYLRRKEGSDTCGVAVVLLRLGPGHGLWFRAAAPADAGLPVGLVCRREAAVRQLHVSMQAGGGAVGGRRPWLETLRPASQTMPVFPGARFASAA